MQENYEKLLVAELSCLGTFDESEQFVPKIEESPRLSSRQLIARPVQINITYDSYAPGMRQETNNSVSNISSLF